MIYSITAKHFRSFCDELAHAILEPLQTMAGRRTVSQDQITAAEHEVIQRLMGLLPK